MNITQRMYFGQFPLDKDSDRRIVFYGRVSTQLKRRSMRLATRCNGTMTSFGIIQTGRSLTAISTRASPEPQQKSARLL